MLSRFTPSPVGLDRDAVLFAAGRASARPGRKWPTLAALLALSQALTLALLVTGTQTAPVPLALPAPNEPGESVSPMPVVRRDWRSALEEPHGSEFVTDDLVPDAPPLHAASVWGQFAME